MMAQPPVRLVIHPGFHKTGTTTIQQFLRENGKAIWPHAALVLPFALRKGPCVWSTNYARTGRDSALQEFGRDMTALLGGLSVEGRNRVLLSDENLAGRMPGRDGQVGYARTPQILAALVAAAHRAFPQGIDVTIHFSTRDRAAWIESTYRHNLYVSRLSEPFDSYAARLMAEAPFAAIIEQTRALIPEGRVTTTDLEDCATLPFGPADPIVRALALPTDALTKLGPVTHRNQGVMPDYVAQLLALNQSGLDAEALIAAKAALTGRAPAKGGHK